MTTVFVDTGYWIAILNPRDDLRDRAIQVTAELEQPVMFITTEMVLTELLNGFAKRGSHIRAAAVDLVTKLRSRPDTTIIKQSQEQFADALDVYKCYDDKEWSLTDCASFHVMKEHQLNMALAHDHHFVQMGFQSLLD